MLQALAGMFFGSPNEASPDADMNCDTQEVDDWLVVNAHADVDIDFDESLDEDDILMAISVLMTPNRDCDTIAHAQPPSTAREDDYVLNSRMLDSSFFGKPSLSVKKSRKLKLSTNLRKDIEEDIRSAVMDVDCKAASTPKPKRERKQRAKACYSTFSTTYVNHRPLTSKIDLLQRIEDLLPEQQAKEHDLSVGNARNKLERQNKSYIYEGGAKTNRRKDLQRKHSGANNNRKC